MEGMASDVPTQVDSREVDPDKDENTPTNEDKKPVDEHMAAILEHVPENLKERVSKLQREELSMPGIPKDREAYEAYLGAEKMIRDVRRREEKKNFSWNGLPKQTGSLDRVEQNEREFSNLRQGKCGD